MEEILGDEEARRKLGSLVTQVAQKREPVIIIHKAKEKAVLLSYEEYKQLQKLSAANAAQTVSKALKNIQEGVKKPTCNRMSSRAPSLRCVTVEKSCF